MTRFGWWFGGIVLMLVLVGTRGDVAGLANGHPGTPTAGSGADAGSDASTHGAEAMRLYDDFIAKLAANLGVADADQVDAAVRTSLKQMVDERQAAGELTAEQATALKERIDAADFPLSLAAGHDRGPGRGGWDDDHQDWDGDRDHERGGWWGDGDRDHGNWDDDHDDDHDDDDHDDDDDQSGDRDGESEPAAPEAEATATS